MIYLFAALGLFAGSFLNVCIDRLPRGESIVKPPSHCASCNRKLGFIDLLPLISYIWLRGRCRYCNASIPIKIPIVEAATGLLFAFLYWQFGLGLELVIALFYTGILLVIFMIDLEHQLVLNIITFPSMGFALVMSFFWPGVRTFSIFWPQVGIESALLGGVVGGALIAVPFILSRGGMGMGDVKLGVLLGLMTGFPYVIMAVMFSWIGGGLVAAVLLLLKIKGRKEAIPFAPFMVSAAFITLLWGETIYHWYVR